MQVNDILGYPWFDNVQNLHGSADLSLVEQYQSTDSGMQLCSILEQGLVNRLLLQRKLKGH